MDYRVIIMSVDQLLLLGIITFSIYFIFIEIFTVLFRLTGMTKSKSKFQVISLFTNSGYTTEESELVMSNEWRRRLATSTMLVGYALNVTVIGVLINIIMTLNSAASADVWRFIIILGSFLLFLFLIARVRFIDQFIQQLIRSVAIRLFYRPKENILEILERYEEFTLAEIHIKKLPERYIDKTLKEMDLKPVYSLQIVAIKRGGKVLATVGGEEKIYEQDVLIISGSIKNMKEVFINQVSSSENE